MPIVLAQSGAFDGSVLPLEFTASNDEQTVKFTVDLSVKHIRRWDADGFTEIIATYFSATSMPTAFVAVPPKESNGGEPQLPLLFLRMQCSSTDSPMCYADPR